MATERHLFYVHSNICFRMACAVIRERRVPSEAVQFLVGRAFTHPHLHMMSSTTEWPLDYELGRLAQPHGRMARDFDATLDSGLAPGPFHAYVPQTTIPFVALLIGHPRCRGFSYLEEGVAAYQPIGVTNALYGGRWLRLKRFLEGYKHRRFRPRPFYDLNAASGWYASSPDAFTFANDRTLLDTVFDSLGGTDEPALDTETVYCVMDGLSLYFPRMREAHIDALAEGVRRVTGQSGLARVAIKPPPIAGAVDEARQLASELTRRCRLDDVPSVIVGSMDMERALYRSKQVQLVTVASSLGLYACRFGHRVYSAASLILEHVERQMGPRHAVDIRSVADRFLELP